MIPGLGGSTQGEDPLEKEMATHSSILAWKISWTEEPGGLQSMGLQRVRHDLETKPPPPRQNELSWNFSVLILTANSSMWVNLWIKLWINIVVC